MYTLYLILLYLSLKTVYSGELPILTEDEEWKEWSANRYKIYGMYTNTPYICMDNCVGGTCITGRDYDTRKPCHVNSNVTTYVYFTAGARMWHTNVCLSRCGKFNGYDYNWCYIHLYGARGMWDYCSPQIYQRKYNVHLTTDPVTRCTTPCQLNDTKYSCNDAWNKARECNPNITVHYIPQYTVEGNLCVTYCTRKTSNYLLHYTCDDINNNKNEVCAPPAQEFGPHTREIWKNLYYLKIHKRDYKGPYDIAYP